MGKCILECMLKDPCPARSSADNRDVCTIEEGACEYQVLGTVDEDLAEVEDGITERRIRPC